MASNDGREGRRRRIMERGSDRMALITGQIRSLDEFPSSPKPPTSTSTTHDHPARTEPAPTPTLSSTAETVDVASCSESVKHMESNEISKSKIEDQPVPDQEKRVTTKETMMAPVLVQTSGVTPSVQTTSTRPNFFSSKRINSCIIASERTRAICSLIIASLVLLSYISYPLVGIDIVSAESIIASRPLYIVLLTDVTIVLARSFRERGNDSEEEEVKEKLSKDDQGDSWVGAVKLLERGLAAYQAIRGIFIDCSVYLVVVICGVCFM